MRREEVVGLAEPALPATVVTAHLATCARAIADAQPAVADLPETADHLVAAQRDISASLHRLATRLARGPLSEERAALVEVLRAASAASEHAADALDAGGHLFEIVANETLF
ncbi:MAG: hypothetical protein M3422_07380 [Actinomycetota bacterium]|nr:hypothetical protein [Actinomycetota bacterium]